MSPFEETQDLLAKLKRKDESAQAQFVRDNMGMMLIVAERIVGNKAEAQDAVQDAFISAFKALDSFDTRSSLRTWLHRIVVNASLLVLRKRSQREELSIEDLLPKFKDGLHADKPIELGIESNDLETNAMLRRDIHTAIQKLPDDYRSIIVLRDIEGFDSQETAARLNISDDAVRQKLHRARLAVVKLLSVDYVGGSL